MAIITPGGTGGGGAPRRQAIQAEQWQAQSGALTTLNASHLYNGYTQTTNQNEFLEYQNVPFSAGTYTIQILCFQHPNAAIATVALDGLSIGTIDMYAAAGVANKLLSLVGAPVGTSGNKALRFTAATKNGSSGGFLQLIQSIVVIQTA